MSSVIQTQVLRKPLTNERPCLKKQGEIAQWLSALTIMALSEDSNSVRSTHLRQLITTCESGLCGTCTHVHVPIQGIYTHN